MKNMEKINKIMVACAFSEHSCKIIKYAAKLAEFMKAELIIANVISQWDVDAVRKVSSLGDIIPREEYIDHQKEERAQLSQKIIDETIRTHLTIKKVFKIGVPDEELVKIINEEGVDLVIIGTKARGSLARVLLGSTSEKMLHRCPVPLLSVG